MAVLIPVFAFLLASLASCFDGALGASVLSPRRPRLGCPIRGVSGTVRTHESSVRLVAKSQRKSSVLIRHLAADPFEQNKSVQTSSM